MASKSAALYNFSGKARPGLSIWIIQKEPRQMPPESSRTQSTEPQSPQNMSWAERKLAEGTWRYRVKHWTKSQRRSRALAFIRLRRARLAEEGLADTR